MDNTEFETVRGLLNRRGTRYDSRSSLQRPLRPATFREIDGSVLARQYVAHRQLMEVTGEKRRLQTQVQTFREHEHESAKGLSAWVRRLWAPFSGS